MKPEERIQQLEIVCRELIKEVERLNDEMRKQQNHWKQQFEKLAVTVDSVEAWRFGRR